MNAFEKHRDEIETVLRQLPETGSARLIFEAPWQARIFAIIVSLVKEGHLPWKEFQSHLAEAISDRENSKVQGEPASLESEYFQNWLTAVEKTLKDLEFMREHDLAQKIDELHSSTTKTRELQLKGRV